ncbi:ABC transporter ATP-binding protein [Spiroplasma corruscae]|uniref:ABC transporter ATP-binding protein n=1 Tax=Spiroplasma corruscae TaxID=216934 RepID=A0A222EQ36_9MOLU|nr:ABC transporter ATP-binding protein [Spiroplasma corruscae]ASP28650.1 ABC transporter ATP-binding protein [Spiroplasma corruscae]
MIKVSDMSKKYGKKTILKSIDLKIKEGERIAIMGLNGSGKTTLGELILKVIKPSSGTIKYKNEKIKRNATFQDGSFDSELNLYQLIKFYSYAFGVKKDLYHLLKDFELDKVAKYKFSKLSGGQKQKFKFLITLINEPSLLLLDELTTSLDYIWRNKIVELVQKYINEKKCTLILVSHDIEEVSSLCDRVLFLKDGVIEKDIDILNNKNKLIDLIKEEIINNDSNI